MWLTRVLAAGRSASLHSIEVDDGGEPKKHRHENDVENPARRRRPGKRR
jgi:hypothetical protein